MFMSTRLRKKLEKAWEPPGPRVDPFTKLPAELIQYITKFSSVRDVLRWMRVCKLWNEMLHHPGLSAFWRRATEYIGVSDYYVQEHFSECAKPDIMFHQVKQYCNHISRVRPETRPLKGIHPFESTSKSEYAGRGYFVKTVDYQSLENEETVIGELCPHRRAIQKVASMPGRYGEVIYASICAGNVIWRTYKGYWFRYDLKLGTFHRLLSNRIEKEMGDSVGHCNHCLLLLIANIESIMHGYNWVLNFFKVEEDGVVRATHKPHIPPGITQFIPRPVKANIISHDGCKTHHLIIQGGTGACVFAVYYNKEEKKITISPKPIATLNPFYDAEIAVMVVTTTSEMILSRDEQVLGILTSIVYPYASGLRLHLFDLKTHERVISVKVQWEEDFNDSRILSLSRLFAVVGMGHSDGVVKIVHCRSGKVISTYSPLCRGLPPVIPMAKLKLVHMQGAYGDECLVDLKGRFSIAVFFRKGVGNIDAVFFEPFPPSLGLLEENNYENDSDNEADDDESFY